jgi:peptide/nickel transport system substrate-binding protein
MKFSFSSKWFASLCVLTLVTTLGGIALGRSDTIVIGTTDQPDKLEPADSYDFPGWWTIGQTHEGLLSLNPRTEEVEPGLASSWTVSANGLVYTFKLRQGVTFTDGEKFNAKAVKQSFERALKLNGDPVFLLERIKSVEAIDDYTVRITLSAPDATFPNKLAFIAPAFITSPKTFTGKTATETFAVTSARGTVGTGPYKLVQYKKDEIAVFEAYDKYWGDKPKTKRIIVRYFPGQGGASTLAMALRKGDVDIAWRTLNPEDLGAFKSNRDVEVIKGVGGLSVRFAAFNVKYKPFDDPRIRQAFAYAVDREAIVSRVFGGLNTAAYSIVPIGLQFRYETYPKRDLNKARQLLQAAGYSERSKLAINLWYDSSGHYSKEPDVAAVVKATLEETRLVDVKLQPLDWGTFVQKFTSGETGFFLLGWYPDYLDAENYLTPFLATSGSPSLGIFYGDPATDKMLDEVVAANDRKTRDSLFKKIQQSMAETVPIIPLWYNSSEHYAVARKGISGLYLPADMEIRLRDLEKN